MSEKVKVKITRNVNVLPAIALRGLVVFPNNIVHFEVGRAKSIAAIEAAMHANSSVFLVAQKEMDVEEPTMPDLYGYGVIAEINRFIDEWAARHGFASLEEFRGKMDFGHPDNDIYQRVQYMKYFPHDAE